LIRSVTVADLKLPSGQFQFVDVRSPSEFASGHIPSAVNIPMDQIEARLDDLRPDPAILLICQMGKRARMTASLLEPCRPEITVLEGGTNAWIEAGLPIVANVKTRWSLERQVRLAAGALALIGAVLGFFVNLHWIFLSAFIGLGLMFAGLTDICPMAEVLGKLPWNLSRHCKMPIARVEISRTAQ
jgi:rhodanese-related sulfurtransferase